MSPLNKTKETKETYKIFINFFEDCIENLPKSVKTKSNDFDYNELRDQLKQDKFLQKIVKQFAQQINKLKDYVRNAKITAGQATDSWKDAFTGWGGFKVE